MHKVTPVLRKRGYKWSLIPSYYCVQHFSVFLHLFVCSKNLEYAAKDLIFHHYPSLPFCSGIQKLLPNVSQHSPTFSELYNWWTCLHPEYAWNICQWMICNQQSINYKSGPGAKKCPSTISMKNSKIPVSYRTEVLPALTSFILKMERKFSLTYSWKFSFRQTKIKKKKKTQNWMKNNNFFISCDKAFFAHFDSFCLCWLCHGEYK